MACNTVRDKVNVLESEERGSIKGGMLSHDEHDEAIE